MFQVEERKKKKTEQGFFSLFSMANLETGGNCTQFISQGCAVKIMCVNVVEILFMQCHSKCSFKFTIVANLPTAIFSMFIQESTQTNSIVVSFGRQEAARRKMNCTPFPRSKQKKIPQPPPLPPLQCIAWILITV